MIKKQIINIVNFIRAVEPRCPIDLVTPVKKQIELMKKHRLKGTFLLQYDALILPEYQNILRSLDRECFEIGVWLEVVQPQVEKAGLMWRGRYPWDWHTHCGFTVGYTKEERERLADVLYEEFKSIFGYYPRVFGSWLIDTHTLRYIHSKYGADALCNCKEQYGTDGYTLWGSYYGQAYYPSSSNIFIPAKSEESQIPVPLFRMLGSDPVYQYDFGVDPKKESQGIQGVITLEPVYTAAGGGLTRWVDWYMKENFNGECLSFGYAQAGQENSFGWEAMKNGLEYQFDLFEKLQKAGKITVETLGESGRWFKEKYSTTPASAICAHNAYDDPDKNALWYCSKYYRIGLYGEKGALRIRDLYIFGDDLPDPYENTVCTENHATYETLPVIDGNRFTGNGIMSGGYMTFEDGTSPHFDQMIFAETSPSSVTATYGDIKIEFCETGLKITAPRPFTVENKIGVKSGKLPKVKDLSEDRLTLQYNDVEYSLILKQGSFVLPTKISSCNNTVEMVFADQKS